MEVARRGRPSFSQVRENLAKILFVAGECYGYEAFLIYRMVFSPVSIRSIYYNLQKGVTLEEFSISRVERAEGRFSWGDNSERSYYALNNKRVSISEEEVVRIRYAIKRIQEQHGPAGN
ncbi:MAG: hypothetical protein QXJ50_01475 [Candidatus Woesearchaeota archaeon]